MDPVSAVQPVRRIRLVEGVVEQLRDLIVSGELPPGQTLLQIELAERLGISRTPLREAFRVLEREGFVRTSNGNKTLEVVSLTADEMLDLYNVREVIDGLAARLAAERRLGADSIDHLRGLVSEMHALAARGEWAQRSNLHADLHAGIAEVSGNRHVAAQVPMIRFTARLLSRTLRSVSETSPDEIDATLAEGEHDHLEILDAIEAGDGRRAESAARRHIRKTMSSSLLQGRGRGASDDDD